MNISEFKEFSKAALDFLVNYFQNIRSRQVLPAVKPGYLEEMLPKETPEQGEHWLNIMEDLEKVIMPGITHWHSPYFHAYMPTANSYPGIIGEFLLSGLGAIGSDWKTNPALTDLELKMTDWLVRLLNLPTYFLNYENGPGGGSIQNAASDSTLVALLAAKYKKITQIKSSTNLSQSDITSRLVAYTSNQANSSVEKAGLLGSVKMKLLPTDDDDSLLAITLEEEIIRDINNGLIPFLVVATLGTTGTCGFDNIKNLGEICIARNIWLHVDAAYAGTALICPEYGHLIQGIEMVDSFTFNAHKWMLVNSDCSIMWFKNTIYADVALNINSASCCQMGQPQRWQIPSCRRFRALKLWIVLRMYGREGIQAHVRKQIHLAKYFSKLISNDERFEVCCTRMGVVIFKMQRDEFTEKLFKEVNKRRNIFVTPYYYKRKFVIRLVVCSRFTNEEDIRTTWLELQSQADVFMPV